MAKILGGLIAAIVLAVAGFFGFQFYTQHRIAAGIDSALEQIRSAGGKASYGKVSYDLARQTLVIDDIVTESAAQPPVSFKIRRLTMLGAAQPDATRFSADSIEATDVEIGANVAAMPGGTIGYKAPQVTIKDYTGPASFQVPPAASSAIDLYRIALAQFAGVSAASINIPSIVGTMNFGPALQDGGFTYSGFEARDIKDGKVTRTKIDNVSFAATMPEKGKPQKLTGEMTNLAMLDFDTTAMAAVLDPQNAKDDRYRRVYRQLAAGSYAITSGTGMRMRIEGLTADDVALQPSRMKIEKFMTMLPAASATPTPAQARELMDTVADLYQGFRIGNAEARDISVQTPDGPVKLSAMRFNLENGKIGEFSLVGLDTRTPKGPVKFERFALKSLDIVGLMRMGALYANPARPPSPDQALGFLPLLEGIELKNFTSPFKNTSKPITIDAINLDWGQFIGPIPSKVRLTARLSGPVDATNPALRPILAAGIDKVALNADLGAGWTETSGAFALEPASIEFGGLLKASLRLSLANVPRGIFATNVAQALAMAAQIDAGPVEFVLRDLGAVDVAVAQYARTKKISRDDARRAIIDSIRESGQETASANPDAGAVVEALTRFFENPGQTLVVKLTPLGKVPALQMVQALQNEPTTALAQFRIEASTGL